MDVRLRCPDAKVDIRLALNIDRLSTEIMSLNVIIVN